MKIQQQDMENKALKEKVSPLNEFLWGFIGLILTVLGTFVEAFVAFPSFQPENPYFRPHSLGVTYQIAGVLLTGCLGGQNAAAYAQIAYVVLGLFKLPVFAQGGGFDYLQQPSFGYILGFIPGAWLCGYLAFPGKRRLESLTLCAVLGLMVIHLCGIIYILGLSFISPLFGNDVAANYIPETINIYSIQTLPSQLIIVCAVALISFIIRLILLY
jgi:biotin transport system substrate-specific component